MRSQATGVTQNSTTDGNGAFRAPADPHGRLYRDDLEGRLPTQQQRGPGGPPGR
ncbi:hypothetical protein ACRAWD_05920 [Caulobacter segnis]